jgi:hypothetical protein
MEQKREHMEQNTAKVRNKILQKMDHNTTKNGTK